MGGHPFRARAAVLRWATVAALAAAIEGLARSGLAGRSTLVPVTTMVGRLAEVVATGAIPSPYFARTGAPSLWVHLSATGTAVLASFALAVASGSLVGALMWRLPGVARALYPYLVLYYALPAFALYPLLILLFSGGLVPLILLGWLFSVGVVVANTYLGFKRVDQEAYVKVGRAMGLGFAAMLRWIYLPGAAPYLFSGWKLAFTYSVIGVIASEFITSYRGLGYVIDRAYRNFETANMYAGILLVLLATAAATALLTAVEARVNRAGRPPHP